MTEIQNLNKHAIICMIIFLLMVLFFLQSRVFSQLFQTILGRAFLVILIIYITYCNQIGGVLFVLFLMIMHTNDSTVEGLSLRNNLISEWSEKLKEEERNQAAVDAMASVNGSSDPHKIFLKSAATIAQDYNNENPNSPFFSIMPAKVTLVSAVRAAKAANSPTAVATAQLNYLESLATIAEKIANSKPFSKESVAFKKAKQAETEASIKAEPRPMASSVTPILTTTSLAPTSTTNAATVTTTAPVTTTTTTTTVSPEQRLKDAIANPNSPDGIYLREHIKTYPNSPEARAYVEAYPESPEALALKANKVTLSDQDKIKIDKAVADTIAMAKNSKMPQFIYQSKSAEIAQQYLDKNPDDLYGIIDTKIQLSKSVDAANTPGATNPEGQIKLAQAIYLETVTRTVRDIARNLGPSSPEAIALKKAEDERDGINTSVVPEPIATSSIQQTQVQTDAQAREDAKNLIKTLTPSPTQSDTSILTQIKKTFTCTENFKALEGFDLLGFEDNMKRGKQSNSIQVGNSYHQNSEDVMPYEKSFFSPFHF